MYLNRQVNFEQAFELARKQLLLRKYLLRIAKKMSADFKIEKSKASHLEST